MTLDDNGARQRLSSSPTDDAHSNTYAPSGGHPPLLPIGAFLLVKRLIDDSLLVLSDRECEFLTLRYGLRDGLRRTLEMVGGGFGVSRERVRQVTSRAIERLRLEDSMELRTAYATLSDFSEQAGVPVPDEGFAAAFAEETGADEAAVSAYAQIAADVFQLGGHLRSPLDSVDQLVVKSLALSPDPLPLERAIAAIRQSPEATEAMADWPRLNLPLRLRLLLGVEIVYGDVSLTATERTLAKLSSTERRLMAIERVLREADHPLHFVDIAGRIEPLLPGEFAMSARNVHAWLDRYGQHFKWAGPGTYGLASWDIGVREGVLDERLRSVRRTGIGDEIALLLSERKEPISLAFLERHVLGRFEVNKMSVYAAVTQDKAGRFDLREDRTVALTTWREMGDAAS